jgi:hypothetical protein
MACITWLLSPAISLSAVTGFASARNCSKCIGTRISLTMEWAGKTHVTVIGLSWKTRRHDRRSRFDHRKFIPERAGQSPVRVRPSEKHLPHGQQSIENGL